ncbi:DMSO reductase anchor subunit [Cedecea neteri]|uniref:DMSO reductase anchor subunit n=1 Tax=Cedecea neteri TaxID=158822 RepID=A0A2X2T2P4_9ENTR|nr:DMSO reductase anchor subunit [Cedecea neteri]
MGNGWHEWPLMVFTVLGQCVAGGFMVMALALLYGVNDRATRRRAELMMVVLWILNGRRFHRLDTALRLTAARLQLAQPPRQFGVE